MTKEQLIAEKNTLHSKLNFTNHDEILPLLRANEQAIKDIDKADLIKKVNAKYSRLRDMALQAYECEQPTEDITTNDGSFHKTRVKKYPKIAALQYASALWENDRLMHIRINGEKFYMFKSKYEYNKETIHTRPATFSEFLELNSIPENNFTVEQYNEIAEKLAAMNEQLKKDIEQYNNGLKSLQISSLNYWGLVGQHNVNLYEYLPTVR